MSQHPPCLRDVKQMSGDCVPGILEREFLFFWETVQNELGAPLQVNESHNSSPGGDLLGASDGYVGKIIVTLCRLSLIGFWIKSVWASECRDFYFQYCFSGILSIRVVFLRQVMPQFPIEKWG